MNFWFFVLASIGLTHIIVESFFMEYYVKSPIKRKAMAENATAKTKEYVGLFLKMVNCFQCAGYWVGMLCGLVVHPFWNCFESSWIGLAGCLLFNIILVPVFVYGPIGSFSAVLGAAILNYLENMLPPQLPLPQKEEKSAPATPAKEPTTDE